jgi:hypothetical protein
MSVANFSRLSSAFTVALHEINVVQMTSAAMWSGPAKQIHQKDSRRSAAETQPPDMHEGASPM